MRQNRSKHTGAFIALALTLWGSGLPAAAGESSPPEPDGVLELRQALELALMYSPELAASSHGALAAEGTARQAGALPNPRLELRASEFGGSGSRTGFDGAETSVQLSQSVELGGKRGARQRAAQAGARLSGREYEAQRLEVQAQTKKAFVEVLLAQSRLALAESLLGVSQEVRKAAEQRVKAGKVSPIEETKAGVELATARIARDRARRELETARQRLAASWGGTQPAFTEAAGDLSAVAEIPPVGPLAARLDSTPDAARWNEAVLEGQESLALEKAKRMPDVDVSAGVSRFEADGSCAGMVGLSIPLPLFDRNSGGIFAAKHQALRAEYEQCADRLRRRTELAEAYSRLEAARAEALAMKAELLPGARQAFDAAQIGYRAGKYGYLEVLDTQRTLSQTQSAYLAALADYHKAAADVERLTGITLNTIQ